MGIDLGIKKIAWAVWEDDVLITTGAYSSGYSLRHVQLADVAGRIGSEVVEHRPNHIFIEDTLIGNNRKYSIQLSETKGAVLAQLGGTYKMGQAAYGYTFGVYLVNVSTWKANVLGNGRADKRAIRFYIEQRSSAYHDLCGNDQDRFDAACIGYYGVLTARKADKLVEGPGRAPE